MPPDMEIVQGLSPSAPGQPGTPSYYLVRRLAAVTGNGPWLDGYVFNLPPLPGAS